MATLILVRNTKGRVVGRCDARCYDAVKDRCRCCCGGVNHGKGYVVAATNVMDSIDFEWVLLKLEQGHALQAPLFTIGG